MATETDIEDLLRQDEAQLKAKRGRLKALAAALDAARAASDRAASAAAEVIENGDLTRAELSKFYSLSKSERGALMPTSQRTSPEISSDSE